MSANSDDFAARPQVDAAHYRPSRYLTPKRLASMGHQLQLVTRHFPGADVLEIGGGRGLVRQLLREEGHRVVALDLDPALRPDLVGALPALPLRAGAIDVVLCCQVLEHMPWEVAQEALREMHRVSRLGCVISVPTIRKAAALTVFGQVRDGSRSFDLPSLGRGRVRNEAEHYWELEAGVRLRAFRAAVERAGFLEVDSFRPVSSMYHHFFVWKKR